MNYNLLRKICLTILLALLPIFLINCSPQENLWGGVNNGDIFDEPDYIQDEILDNLAKADLRVIRVWIDFRLEVDEDGNPQPVGLYSDCILEKIDSLMVKAKRKGILLFIVFQQHNFLGGGSYSINSDSYGWRKCKTPENKYNTYLETGISQSVAYPYHARWGSDYINNPAAKNAYKLRVSHILNHFNPYFGKSWKEINDVIWAWGLQNEPEYIPGSFTNQELRDWLREMATYVKTVDADTYVALGTKNFNVFYDDSSEPVVIEDADVYTVHKYGGYSSILRDKITEFQTKIGIPYGKLLLVEETNGEAGRHTPGRREEQFDSSTRLMESKVPWMFWEHGYQYDSDDIWHANGMRDNLLYSDGVMWDAKVVPAAKKIWETSWDWSLVGKKWKVHDMVDELCAFPDAACNRDTNTTYFLDTFNNPYVLQSGYNWFDEENPDTYDLVEGYLRIEAGAFQDLWGGPPLKRGAPIMFRTAPEGNYYAETFVSADPAGKLFYELPSQGVNTQIGLFVFQDINNWIFFGLTNHDIPDESGDGLIVTLTEDDNSSIVEKNSLQLTDYAFLKIVRDGNIWKFYWKLNHSDAWHLLTTVSFAISSNHEIGMGVKTLDVDLPISHGVANFDYFLIKEWVAFGVVPPIR